MTSPTAAPYEGDTVQLCNDKGEWTVNEAKDYAKYCLLENYTDEKD